MKTKTVPKAAIGFNFLKAIIVDFADRNVGWLHLIFIVIAHILNIIMTNSKQMWKKYC